jgi:hypothetical protein
MRDLFGGSAYSSRLITCQPKGDFTRWYGAIADLAHLQPEPDVGEVPA